MNYVSRLESAAANVPDRTAIIWDNPDGPIEELTFASLIENVNRMANALKHAGIKPGDRVAIMLNNRPEFPISYYACGKVGATAVLVNTLLKGPEIEYILRDSSCRLLVTNAKGFAEAYTVLSSLDSFDRAISVEPVDGALYFQDLISVESSEAEMYEADWDDVPEVKYTSGTTGYPKGVMHTHRNIITFVDALHEVFPSQDDDKVLCFMPLYHGFGDMTMMHPTLFGEGTLILQDPFDPHRVLSAIQKYHATIMGAVPAVFWVLLNTPGVDDYDVASLRFVMSGGQSIPLETITEFEERFGCTVYEGYGLTESTAGTSSGLPDMPRKIGSVGLPLPGVEIMVVDSSGRKLGASERGEILIRSALNMKGYLGKPKETAEVLTADGWLHTGDVGYLDEDGYLFIVDRLKDMIIMTGENIYPSEIENVIAQHPAIAQVAVVGATDPRRGQVPKAVISLRPGMQLGEDELIKWCSERMAPFKVPRIVEVRDALPLTPSGKVSKKEL
jgi:long-chain acyl-CoA synthetase